MNEIVRKAAEQAADSVSQDVLNDLAFDGVVESIAGWVKEAEDLMPSAEDAAEMAREAWVSEDDEDESRIDAAVASALEEAQRQLEGIVRDEVRRLVSQLVLAAKEKEVASAK